MENIGDRQDQKQYCQQNIGKSKMDHGKSEGHQEEKADKFHGDEMGQPFCAASMKSACHDSQEVREVYLVPDSSPVDLQHSVRVV